MQVQMDLFAGEECFIAYRNMQILGNMRNYVKWHENIVTISFDMTTMTPRTVTDSLPITDQ